jgi:hypothetical protein
MLNGLELVCLSKSVKTQPYGLVFMLHKEPKEKGSILLE